MADVPPVVFLSHGAGPSYYLEAETMPVFKGIDKHSKAADFLRNFTNIVGLGRKPEAILVISAHWDSKVTMVNTNTKHSLLFDYAGFPPEAYSLQWPAPGAPEVGKKAMELLKKRGFQCLEDQKRGLDHGVFVPLKLVFPEADIPVTQVSLLSSMNVADHLAIGETLRELRQQGVLVIGSGFATHKGGAPGQPTPQWTIDFQRWLHDVILSDKYSPDERRERLLACEKIAPYLDKAHPTIEHLLPIVMCSAVAGYKPGKLLYSELVMQSLLNEHYVF